MVHPHLPGAQAALDTNDRARYAHRNTARSERRPQRSTPLTRRYEVAGLTHNGDIQTFSKVAPATPSFEDAFASFARGTLIHTPNGPTAIEDLTPGDMVETAQNGAKPIQWIGSIAIHPGLAGQGEENATLTRVTADSFGLGRPMPDLMLGSRARLLFRNTGCEDICGSETAYAPASAFIDGYSMINVRPVSSVRLYHLAVQDQETILANGLEMESYHPGVQTDSMLDLDVRETFMAMFPHARTIQDFGQMRLPRLTRFEVDRLRST